MERFDVMVIGSGSGLDVANATARHGKRTVIIERNGLGGTCLNHGCIPSKMLIHSADVAETIKRAKLFGINTGDFSVDFEKIVRRVNEFTDGDSDQIRNAFSEIQNPKLFSGECKFTGKKTVQIGDKTVSADTILIACGSRPSIPKIKGLDKSGFITSTEALRLKRQPKVLTIIGGGYIGCELAHFFGALGTNINMIQRSEVLLTNEDWEISKKITDLFSKKFSLYTNHDVALVSKNNDSFEVEVIDSLGNKKTITSDQLLVATGRTPNTDTLDLAKTGVDLDEKGYVIVDKHLQTNVEGIFALGDVVGKYPFKHAANMEAEYAFTNMLHQQKLPVDYTAMPHAIFCSPQIAGVGLTEQELKERGVEYAKSVYQYYDTAMGKAIEDEDGFVKFLVDKKSKKILGCHIIGADASTLIHEVLVAMRGCDGTIDAISRTIFVHPALSEVIARAAYSVDV